MTLYFLINHHEVETFTDPTEGLQLLRLAPTLYDAVVIDIETFPRDSLEVIRAIRRGRLTDIPIIGVTEEPAWIGLTREARAAGASGLVSTQTNRRDRDPKKIHDELLRIIDDYRFFCLYFLRRS